MDAGIVTPIKDQHINGSKCGCCYAFAGVAGIEATNAKFTGKVCVCGTLRAAAAWCVLMQGGRRTVSPAP